MPAPSATPAGQPDNALSNWPQRRAGPAATGTGPAPVGPSPGLLRPALAKLARAAAPVRLTGTEAAPLLRGWLQLGGLCGSLPAALAIAQRSRYAWDFVLYGIALVGLYAVSSAYHLLPIGALARHWLRRADHACIYAYMACAFTPFSLSLAPGPFGLALVATAWACAVVGVLAKLVHFERTRRLGGALYMVVGWVPAATLPYAFRHL